MNKIAILFLLLIFTLTASAQSDIQIVKQRVLTEVMKTGVDDKEVAKLLETISINGTWPGINYQDVSRTGFEHRNHTENMVKLARSYQNNSSEFHENIKVLETINLALKNWVNHDYFCDNWWHNQIGTPYNLVNLMLIVGTELNADLVEKAQPIIGRANVDAPGARPGGDRIKIAGIQAKNCLFLSDDTKFNKVIRVIESEIKYVEWIGAKYGFGFREIIGGFENRSEEGRGIQYDNSFHHRTDGVNNTLSYGQDYAAAFVEWAEYTHGTKYTFSDEKLAQLIDYYLDGICKTAVFGKYPDAGAKNRSITRKDALHKYSASLAKKLLQCSTYRKNELQEIIDVRETGIKPTLSHATYFWHSEHFTFQRPNWFTSVRLYSTRNYNMEQPYNSEGLLNHHRGDGANHISVSGNEYYDLAPVFDYQKIPGTTVMQKPALPSERDVQKLGLTDFVGAVTDGKYAAVAFDFKSPHDPLIARKSWFFFDDEYVCLGTGISCKTNLPVVTTLNQCLLRGDITLSVKNNKTVIPIGEEEFENVDWVFHDGVGYVFPEPNSVQIKNNAARGSWYRVNKQSTSPKKQIEMDVFKLWLNHGERANEESYAYIVVPATSLTRLENNTSKNNIKILANSPEIQAVKHKELNKVQAVFYKSGHIKISEEITLFSDSPGIIMLKLDGERVSEISVSDPNRELLKFHLSVSSEINKQGENFISNWNEMEGRSEIKIDLPQGNYAGQSVTIKLNK